MKNLRRWLFFKYLSWLVRYLFNGFGYNMKFFSCDAISVKEVSVHFSEWNDLNRDFESQLWLGTGIKSKFRTQSEQRWLCFAWLQNTAIKIKSKKTKATKQNSKIIIATETISGTKIALQIYLWYVFGFMFLFSPCRKAKSWRFILSLYRFPSLSSLPSSLW